nr:MAG TPA: hypothetical protein [Caudoviricetes sp.]
MNNRQLEAARHARELRSAKRELMYKANQQIQAARVQGYETELAPQLVRLLGVKSYRKRDLQAMNRAVSSPEKLSEYIAVLDPNTKEVVQGGQAFERWIDYINSGIYREQETDGRLYGISDVSQIPTEAEITLNNFVSESEKAFLDDQVYNRFIDTLDKLSDGDTSVADDAMWSILHPGIFETKKGKSRSQSSIQHSKKHFINDVNRINIWDIKSAVAKLTESEGIESVVKRLHDAGEDIINDLIIAGIGYEEQAGAAVQAILTVLLPSSVRDRALAMGDIPEMVDDFNGEMRE